jgi:hypothetical protein
MSGRRGARRCRLARVCARAEIIEEFRAVHSCVQIGCQKQDEAQQSAQRSENAARPAKQPTGSFLRQGLSFEPDAALSVPTNTPDLPCRIRRTPDARSLEALPCLRGADRARERAWSAGWRRFSWRCRTGRPGSGALAAPGRSLTPGMGFSILIESFIVTVIGGMGSIVGAFVAALAIGLIRSFGSLGFPLFTDGLMYLFMVLVLIAADRLVRQRNSLTMTRHSFDSIS